MKLLSTKIAFNQSYLPSPSIGDGLSSHIQTTHFHVIRIKSLSNPDSKFIGKLHWGLNALKEEEMESQM